MADVSIDAAISTSTARSMRGEVWHKTNANIGYQFHIDSDADFSYCKTTDGGASWGAAVQIGPNDTDLAFDVWADWWTPGNTGTLIHCVWFGTTLDDVLYRTIDTANADALGTQRTVFTGSTAVAAAGNTASVTVTNSGYIYVAFDLDAGAERGLHRSTDGGATWSANLSTTFVEAADDFAMLFPAQNTGDGNDCWALYVDADANAITLKLWDSSAGSATESATITAYIDSTTDLVNQHGFSASLRHSDGHLILVAFNDRNTITADLVAYDITSTGTFAALTTLTTNTANMYYPSVFIDQDTDDIYVAYNGTNTGLEVLGTTTHIYYRKSTDGGSTWDAQVQYSEGLTTAKIQTWAPIMGTRFHVGWRVGSTLLGNKVNSISFAVPAVLVAEAGSYAVTGTAASLEAGRKVVAGVGSFTITGTAASLEANREVAAIPGAYDVTGVAASLRAALKLVAAGGAYAIDGVAATLRISKTLAADPGGYAIIGGEAGFQYDRVMPADPGAVAIDGAAAALRRTYQLEAEAGSYQITGTPARATLSLDVLPSSSAGRPRVIIYDRV